MTYIVYNKANKMEQYTAEWETKEVIKMTLIEELANNRALRKKAWQDGDDVAAKIINNEISKIRVKMINHGVPASDNYYDQELQKLNFNGDIKVKFYSDGGDTHHMNIDDDSIEAIIDFLNNLKGIKK